MPADFPLVPVEMNADDRSACAIDMRVSRPIG
jgi:hypothetical protein